MNAYIASFMLLLFNAVGLAVPASAAAEEHVVPRLGSAESPADRSAAGQSGAIESRATAAVDHPLMAMAVRQASTSPAPDPDANESVAWAIVTTVSETGDKLEHEEGAP